MYSSLPESLSDILLPSWTQLLVPVDNKPRSQVVDCLQSQCICNTITDEMYENLAFFFVFFLNRSYTT